MFLLSVLYNPSPSNCNTQNENNVSDREKHDIVRLYPTMVMSGFYFCMCEFVYIEFHNLKCP